MKIRTLAAGLVMAITSGVVASAATQQTTQYSSYPVTGRNPTEIYRAILNRGPMVEGKRAIAATTSQAVQSHVLTQGSSSCRVTEFRLNFRFDVKLPRHTTLAVLSPRDRYLWQQFLGFLKTHELQHTRLWLQCGANLERQVMSLRAASCAEVERRAEDLWRRMKPSCDRQQVDFDKQQRGELMSHPFMQKVMRGD
ncbi:MAG: DUF922 domain-containing protein [Aestuariivirga sp.]|uniref:DUF922 domain-containing protein n=1 Tax=Aestuariivirga sp. TaxID=2650926 RepID=UPI003015CA5D